MPSQQIAITLTAHNDRFDDDDDRWLAQLAELRRELRVETGAVTDGSTPIPGTKGSIDQLILTLGSAGVFTAAVETVRLWLSRDRLRTVQVSWQGDDGRQHEVHLSADNATSTTLAPLVEAVARRVEAS
jgi:Effector Associated Constant Component 1